LAALFWSAAPCGRLRRSRPRYGALARGEKDASIPAKDVNNEIGDIRPRRRSVPAAPLSTPTPARESGGSCLAEQRLARKAIASCSKPPSTGFYVTTPAARFSRNPALARIMGYETPED